MADGSQQPLIPAIQFLKIERFRGIEHLEWRPCSGLNVIVGPGDTCKTTILEAISLLFSPAPNTVISEFDYFKRDASKGFTIEAVLAVGDGGVLKGDKFPLPPMRGWLNGQLTELPDEDGAEAVLLCRLSGTPDFECIYEVIGADDQTVAPLTRGFRQRIGMLRLGVGDRGDRDLRLVQGGALDRFMEGQQLRQTILQAVVKTRIYDQLGDEPKETLQQIEDQFTKKSLPHPIRLGLVGTPGVSLAASVGLTVGTDDQTALPLTSWGTGTRRLASLEIASLLTNWVALAVVDEPEAGLEPYRQRAFVHDLHHGGKRQAFVTTHSPATLATGVTVGSLVWRINATAPPSWDVTKNEVNHSSVTAAHRNSHVLTALESAEIRELLKTQPEVVFARLPVVCEGKTEEGFISRLFAYKFGDTFSARGIFCADGAGHDRALPICQKLIEAGFVIGAVSDDEGRKSGRWAEVEKLGILLRWDDGASMEKAILSALPDSMLPAVVTWASELSGREEKHHLAELREALGVEDKTKTAEQYFAERGRAAFLSGLVQAACPPRQGQKKARGWFKTFDGGYLLADKILAVEPKPALLGKIEAFLTTVEKATA